ncbi:nucleolar protein 12 isoform X2 [Cynocephalus volans]|uniref:nucleolar protein 12 isoform X2 n=1 Tax=Cynocephalus volans TaxID=110931 RepID=UPI002FC84FCB
MGRNKKKQRGGGDRRPRLVLSFDEEKRREYLTGFHKRKVERKKAAIEEIKHRLKKEQKKLREERHQEYLKMLAEREEALEEADELDRLVTARTESVQYDHPNHTVTVTTISNLDLSGARLLGLPPPDVGPSPGSQGWVPGGGIIHGEANQSLTQEVQRPPALSADLLPHSIAACTQPQKGQEETSPSGPGLHEEAPNCHSYQQDPATPTDWQSPAQWGMSPESQVVTQLRCRDLSCVNLAVPVSQPAQTPEPKVGRPRPLCLGLPLPKDCPGV